MKQMTSDRKTSIRKAVETLESRFCLSAGSEVAAPMLHVAGQSMSQVTAQAVHPHQAEAIQRTLAAYEPFARAGHTAVLAIANDYAAKAGVVISWDSPVGENTSRGRSGGRMVRGEPVGNISFPDRPVAPGLINQPIYPPKGEVQNPPNSEVGPITGGQVAQPPATGTVDVVVNQPTTESDAIALSAQAIRPAIEAVAIAFDATTVAQNEIFSERFIADVAPTAALDAGRSAIAALSEGPFITGAELGGEVTSPNAISPDALGAVASAAAARVQSVIGDTLESFAPAQRIFTFAHLGSPLNFVGDSVASFVEDSASATITAVAGMTNPSTTGPWALTFTVLAADAILLAYIHRNRKPRVSYVCTRLGE